MTSLIKHSLPLPIQDLDLILAETASLWEEMRGQSVFITGGTGFFGCWLLESFCHINRKLDLEARAFVLTRNPKAFLEKCSHLNTESSLTLLAGDVSTFQFPEGDFQYVIHAATETSVNSSLESQRTLLHNIVGGTERVLQFSAARKTRKFLLTSSGAVYGKQPSDISHLPETYTGAPDPLHAASSYGEGKRMAELLCALYGPSHNLQCKIARCWAFCGPHLPLDKHFAIGNFIADVMAGRAIQIKGDGTTRRSYLYAADLAIWLWTMLFRGPTLLPVNVGSGFDVSILKLAETVARVLNPAIKITIAQPPTPGEAPSRYVPSVARAKDLLGLSPIINLEDSIYRTAFWQGWRRDIDARVY